MLRPAACLLFSALILACSGDGDPSPRADDAPTTPISEAAQPDDTTDAAADPPDRPAPDLGNDANGPALRDYAVWLNADRVRPGFTVYVRVQAAGATTPAPPDRPVRVHFDHPDGGRVSAELEATGFSGDLPSTWAGPLEFPRAGEWQGTVVTAGGASHAGPVVPVLPPANLTRPFPDLPAPAFVNEIWLLDDTAGSPRLVTEIATGSDLAWIDSPPRLVFEQRRAGVSWLVALDIGGGEPQELIPVDGAQLSAAPTGDALLVRQGRPWPDPPSLQLFDVGSGAWQDVAIDGPAVRPSWAPNGRALLLLDERVRLLRPDGSLVAEHSLSEPRSHDVAWSADGRFAILAPGSSGAHRLDAASGELSELLAPEDIGQEFGPRGDASVSPDTTALAVAWRGPTGSTLAIVRAAASRADLLSQPPVFQTLAEPDAWTEGWILGLAWSPDGGKLAFTVGAGDEAGLWIYEIASGSLTHAPNPDWARGFYWQAPAWSTDGTQLVATRATCFYACDGPSWGVAAIDARTGAQLWEAAGARLVAGARLLYADAGGLAAAGPANAGYLLDAPGRVFETQPSTDRSRTAVLGRQDVGVSLYEIRLDGAGHQRIGPPGAPTNPPTAVLDPAGEREARFLSDGVAVAAPDGTQTLISDLRGGPPLAWAPDGSALAFTAQESLYYGAIVVAAADGSGAYLLVEGGGELLEWRDDGTIVYQIRLSGA